MSAARNIGLDVKGPTRLCEDPNCPFHGTLRVRGKIITGKVVSVASGKMAVIQRESYRYSGKYMRYLKRRNKLHAHLPPCLELAVDDTAVLAECRPLSKTISFVVVNRVSAPSGSGKGS
jgi:small subunit ribosomal protein S17